MKSTANEARKGEGIVMNNSKRDSSYNSLSLSLSLAGWLADTETESPPSGLMFPGWRRNGVSAFEECQF